jgi:hypothetical protein
VTQPADLPERAEIRTMVIRARLLRGATAVLYFGPLLAGLAGFGWAMLPPFVSIFVFWLMLLRPHQWPQTPGEWLTAQALLNVTTLMLTQTLLVAALFGIGRGIGGVAGHLPLFHPFLPLGLSFLALPLARLIWNAEQAAARGVTLDDVLYPQATAIAEGMAADLTPRPRADDEVRPLLALADDAPLVEVGPALDNALNKADAGQRLSVLADALDAAPTRHRALREALVIWATGPEHFAANTAPTGLRAAFRAAGHDLDVLRLLLPRAAALARMIPERQDQFPERAALDALADLPLAGQLAADHAALMGALGHRKSRSKAKAGLRIGQAQPTSG